MPKFKYVELLSLNVVKLESIGNSRPFSGRRVSGWNNRRNIGKFSCPMFLEAMCDFATRYAQYSDCRWSPPLRSVYFGNRRQGFRIAVRLRDTAGQQLLHQSRAGIGLGLCVSFFLSRARSPRMQRLVFFFTFTFYDFLTLL